MLTFRHVAAVLGLLLFAVPSVWGDPPDFGRHVTPLFYKLGCSAGACHGSFAGKGGFRLSLFAGQADADYANVRGGFGRRINSLVPEQSLLLLKPTGAIAHLGGVRLQTGSREYQIFKDWIVAGARFDSARAPVLVAVRVEPSTLTITPGAKPQILRVLAKLSNGSEEDVTFFTRFESLDPGIAAVDAEGRVTGQHSGDVPILAHYAGQIGFTTAVVPGLLPPNMKFPEEELRDPLDKLLVSRLKLLNIVPSPRAGDLEFLRRVYLDVIGQLPTPNEVRQFLADQSADKRAKLIDELLRHPLHAALWAGKMCDIIGADDRFIGNNVYQFHDWFRNKFENNVSWDKIAFGVLCATAADGRTPQQIQVDLKKAAEERKLKDKLLKDKKGPRSTDPNIKPWQTGYALRNTLDVFYANLINQQTINNKRLPDARKIALRVAHTFLGVRLECAQCHKHPNDRWSQADYFSFAAAFSYVEYGVDPELKAQKANLAGTHPTLKAVEMFHDPDTGALLSPRVLGGHTIAVKAGVDARAEVWKWLVAENNPYFARAIVNRVWGHYLGRSFIEPADAQSAANPPSHPQVLDALVRDFIQHKYDLRYLERRVLNTLAYQRSHVTNGTNAKDERNFSHRLLRRLSAEQALDAIAQATGTPVKIAKRFAEVRAGDRAAEVALSRVGGEDGYVLQIFGRPLRTQNCDCERSSAASLSQTLYLYNDEKLLGKISAPKGRLEKLLQTLKDDRQVLEELYLATLTRYPTASEINRTLAHVGTAASRQEGFQDVLWSLLNRHEFLVNH